MNFLLILSFFFIEEIKLNIRRVKILYVFFKEFSIFRFFAYLFDNSIVPCRDKTFRDYILKNSQKWANKENSKNTNGKKILVTNIFNHVGYTVSELVLGKNLTDILNAEGIGILNYYDLKRILLFRSFGIKKIIFLKSSNFFVRLRYFVKAYFKIRSCKNMDEFLNFNINGVEIGKTVYDHYIRFSGIGTTNVFNRKFYTNLARAFLVYHQMEKYFKTYNFISSVQMENQFIPGAIMFQSALKNGANVYTRFGTSNSFTVRKYTNINQKYNSRDYFLKEVYELININIKKKAVEIGGDMINKRFDHILGYESVLERFELPKYAKGKKFKKIEKKDFTKRELCKRLGWKINYPIAVIFATDLTDGIFASSWSVFRDRLTWLRETLYEIKKITDVNWLVKPHPNDEINEVVTSTISEYENICSNLDHVKIFPEDVSRRSIIKFIDAALTLNGSAASEYPCFGIPTIVPCESAGSGYGFTVESKSKDEFFYKLRNIRELKKLNIQQIELAKIYIFIYMKLARITSNLIVPYGFDHVDEKDYWTKMVRLLDKYNYKDDLLIKMMKIQESNNDTHTIDYDMIMNKNLDTAINEINRI
tara:strand:+ start:1010 stop:2785 length:1776 start_codon:yes stop_codon:yes gene_type:complete